MIARVIGLAALLVSATASAAPPPAAQTMLFIGNSFTFGAYSPVWHYRAASVTDLNGDGVGGVPALFKLFTEEAGLNYTVSLETSPGKSLAWHLANKTMLVDRAWDHVVLQEYSTLDPEKPGDPARSMADAGRFAAMFTARNPDTTISLTATWSRPDLVYPPGKPWSGTPIAQMATDLRRGADAVVAATPAIRRINPVGEAFTCAITAGVADPDPYDGIAAGQIDLWAYDHYHASVAGYYLEALVIFGGVTGLDPQRLGATEIAAAELGLSHAQATALQRVAALQLAGKSCTPPG